MHTGRLVHLNKDPTTTPGINKLRFINVLSPLLKVIESIILARITEVVEAGLHPSQHGFRKGHNTALNIIELYETVTIVKAGTRKKPTPKERPACLFIDFKRASDSAN